MDGSPFEGLDGLGVAVDDLIAVVREPFGLLGVGIDQHVVDPQPFEFVEQHVAVAAVLADNDVVVLRGEPVVQIEGGPLEQGDDQYPEGEKPDRDPRQLHRDDEDVHPRRTPRRVRAVARGRHRLDDGLERPEQRVGFAFERAHSRVVDDGVKQDDTDESGRVPEEESLATREVLVGPDVLEVGERSHGI
ncbi:hypothetical protein [Halalkalicoccus jeotgali]|uniref:hypothetical protein n=1 Tax=Halalkalicoccus jeotgali TaxID=413810 RepID=UPI001EE665C9|nr:hypothetical protein [Halalkalicoccus jeotgali]